MPPLSPGGRNQLLFPPARSLTHPLLGGAKGRGEGRGIPLPARARLRTWELSPCGGKARGGERGQGGSAAPSAPPPRDGRGSPVPSACRRTGREGRAPAPGRGGTAAEPPSPAGSALRCVGVCGSGSSPGAGHGLGRAAPSGGRCRTAHAGGARGERRGERGGLARAGTGRHGPGCARRAEPRPRGVQRERETLVIYLQQACVIGGVQQKEHANYQNFFHYLYVVAHTGIKESQRQLG